MFGNKCVNQIELGKSPYDNVSDWENREWINESETKVIFIYLRLKHFYVHFHTLITTIHK